MWNGLIMNKSNLFETSCQWFYTKLDWHNGWRKQICCLHVLLLFLKNIRFPLNCNKFTFENKIHNQLERAAMGTKYTPLYVCPTIKHQEQTNLFIIKWRKYFTKAETN